MIDWSQVNQLKDDVGEDTFPEVVALFLDEVEEAIAPLRTGTLAATEMATTMHFLKGCAFSLGFRDFGNACNHAEMLANSGRVDQVETSTLVALFELSRDRFRDLAQEKCGLAA